MRPIQLARAVVVLAFLSTGTCIGASVTHQFTELVGGPQQIEQFPSPITFNLGVTFDQIDGITFELNGNVSTHSWIICDVNFGCTFFPQQTFDRWVIDIYNPGDPLGAPGNFAANGGVSLTLPLSDRNGDDWEELRTGDLAFVLRPVADGILPANQYWQLFSRPTVTFNDVSVTFHGQLVPEPATFGMLVMGAVVITFASCRTR